MDPRVSAGMVVQGVARLRYSTLKPLYQSKLVNREVAVHWHYVNESMALFLFYFLQLAVMATYISQDLVKLVPLLTIIFAFGRYVRSLSHTVKCLGSKPKTGEGTDCGVCGKIILNVVLVIKCSWQLCGAVLIIQ